MCAQRQSSLLQVQALQAGGGRQRQTAGGKPALNLVKSDNFYGGDVAANPLSVLPGGTGTGAGSKPRGGGGVKPAGRQPTRGKGKQQRFGSDDEYNPSQVRHTPFQRMLCTPPVAAHLQMAYCEAMKGFCTHWCIPHVQFCPSQDQEQQRRRAGQQQPRAASAQPAGSDTDSETEALLVRAGARPRAYGTRRRSAPQANVRRWGEAGVLSPNVAWQKCLLLLAEVPASPAKVLLRPCMFDRHPAAHRGAPMPSPGVLAGRASGGGLVE